MAKQEKPEVGTIGWVDLTVPDATEIRDFYAAVVGWKPTPVEMKGYSDFAMTTPSSGTATSGVCHRRGTNADLPTGWTIYVNVANLDESMARCVELGGKVVVDPKGMGGAGRYCMIQDPSGATCALFEPA